MVYVGLFGATPDHVLKTLQHFGISKIRPRSKNAGVNRKSDHSTPIITVVDYRSREHREEVC